MPQADLSQRLWGGARPAVFEGAPPRDFHTPQVLRTKPQRDESPELCVHLTASEGTSRWEFQNHQRKEEKSITGPKPGTSFLINILLRLWLPVSLLINLLVETLICERSNNSKQSERKEISPWCPVLLLRGHHGQKLAVDFLRTPVMNPSSPPSIPLKHTLQRPTTLLHLSILHFIMEPHQPLFSLHAAV